MIAKLKFSPKTYTSTSPLCITSVIRSHIIRQVSDVAINAFVKRPCHGYGDTPSTVYGYHRQKTKRKIIFRDRIKKMWNGQTVWTNKYTYDDPTYTLIVYEFSEEFLRAAGLCVKQQTNNFKLIKK